MNHAVFCVTPISFAICIELIPLRAVTTKVHRIEPFVQRDVRPLENGSGADSEIQLAFVAAVEPVLASGETILTSAGRAGRPLGPETRFEVHSRRLCVGEHGEKLEGTDCALAHGWNPRRGCVPAPGYQSDAPLTSSKARRSLDRLGTIEDIVGNCAHVDTPVLQELLEAVSLQPPRTPNRAFSQLSP